MASQLRRTDDLQRLKVRDLIIQKIDGSYPDVGSILVMGATGHVVFGSGSATGPTGTTGPAGATGATGPAGGSASTIYTNNIRPYPPGSTGPCNISGRVSLNNQDTNDGADVTLLEMIQSDAGGTGGAIMYVVGEDSLGFGGTPNDQNQFCTYVYPKPARAPITKVESTPLMAGTVGPVGLTGVFGDKYFYGNVQVGGYVAAPVATIKNVIVGSNLTAPRAQVDDMTVGSNMAIGMNSAVHALDVNGQVYISGPGSASQVFTAPGRYTIRIPENVGLATVTLVGAGGYGSAGGRGGYIQGTFNTAGYTGQTLTIQVGGTGVLTPPTQEMQPSTASFISFLAGGPILAMAGAGGGSAQVGAVISAGGHGGGGIARFTAITGGSVSIGIDGQTVGGAGGGQGGQLAAGGAGGSVFGSTPGPSGNGRPGVETYADVPGGFGGQTIAGGNGYTSGGAGGVVETPGLLQNGGGGGGSSYVNTVFKVSTSLRGDDTTSYDVTVPPGYGRSAQGGYVSISYTNPPSLYTSGDIVSGAGLRISVPSAPTNANSTGSPGQIAWDTDYIYVCVVANIWKRSALSSWP